MTLALGYALVIHDRFPGTPLGERLRDAIDSVLKTEDHIGDPLLALFRSVIERAERIQPPPRDDGGPGSSNVIAFPKAA